MSIKATTKKENVFEFIKNNPGKMQHQIAKGLLVKGVQRQLTQLKVENKIKQEGGGYYINPDLHDKPHDILIAIFKLKEFIGELPFSLKREENLTLSPCYISEYHKITKNILHVNKKNPNGLSNSTNFYLCDDCLKKLDYKPLKDGNGT